VLVLWRQLLAMGCLEPYHAIYYYYYYRDCLPYRQNRLGHEIRVGQPIAPFRLRHVLIHYKTWCPVFMQLFLISLPNLLSQIIMFSRYMTRITFDIFQIFSIFYIFLGYVLLLNNNNNNWERKCSKNIGFRSLSKSFIFGWLMNMTSSLYAVKTFHICINVLCFIQYACTQPMKRISL